MKYDYIKQYAKSNIIDTSLIKRITNGGFSNSDLNLIKYWQKKHKIEKLRKGLYFFSDSLVSVNPVIFAYQIYNPSYISLEYALSYYSIIPEAVSIVTSVTTKKTKSFKNNFAFYEYRKIKSEAFGGYKVLFNNNISYFMALPEKALVDWLYLNRHKLNGDKEEFESFRFSHSFRYNKSRIKEFASKFKNKKTKKLSLKFIEYAAE